MIKLTTFDISKYLYQVLEDGDTNELLEKDVSTDLDTLDEMISDKRIDELKSGTTEVYSLEEVAKKLGL